MTDGFDDWTVAEAKARFSELLERASRCGPQAVSRHGRPYAVVASVQDWARGGRRRSALSVLLKTQERFSLDDRYLDALFPRLGPPQASAAGAGTVGDGRA